MVDVALASFRGGGILDLVVQEAKGLSEERNDPLRKVVCSEDVTLNQNQTRLF